MDPRDYLKTVSNYEGGLGATARAIQGYRRACQGQPVQDPEIVVPLSEAVGQGRVEVQGWGPIQGGQG